MPYLDLPFFEKTPVSAWTVPGPGRSQEPQPGLPALLPPGSGWGRPRWQSDAGTEALGGGPLP